MRPDDLVNEIKNREDEILSLIKERSDEIDRAVSGKSELPHAKAPGFFIIYKNYRKSCDMA